MFFNILMIIIGFIFLVLGANLLVKGSSNIAKKFHIPEILLGLTIVALGTSMPELFITASSAKKDSYDLIIGNAIGSNFCNLLLILGIMAIMRPVKIDKDAKKIHLPIAIISTLVILFLSFFFNTINRTIGIILIILFFAYFSYPILTEIEDIIKAYKENKENKNTKKINIFSSIIFIIIGIVLLKYGGDFVVDYSINIANTFNLSERLIALTIIAVGTALPELVTSIVATIKKDTDLAVGNLVGSCILNLFLIIGLGSLITPLPFSKEYNENLILLAFSTFLLWIFNYIEKKDTITRFKGFILLLIYTIYFISIL